MPGQVDWSDNREVRFSVVSGPGLLCNADQRGTDLGEHFQPYNEARRQALVDAVERFVRCTESKICGMNGQYEQEIYAVPVFRENTPAEEEECAFVFLPSLTT